MKTEEIIERLRHPHKYRTQASQAQQNANNGAQAVQGSRSGLPGWLIPVLALGIVLAIFVTWSSVINTKNKAENISQAIEPEQLEGLTSSSEFDPSKEVAYIQFTEGADRNVAVDALGTTLPIISRYNYQSIPTASYKIIGLAPWALTENFSANVQDPQLIYYLLNRPEVGEAFISRPDVAPLLEDPQLLSALAQDNAKLAEFFGTDPVKTMLENEQMVRAVGASRFMSYLLISKSVKYYRDHPQEAAQLIASTPALSELRQNPYVRQAVQANHYLKSIAPQLLGPEPAPAPAAAAPTAAQPAAK